LLGYDVTRPGRKHGSIQPERMIPKEASASVWD
jgi:hypothetical protein